jgi:hypothetical protein
VRLDLMNRVVIDPHHVLILRVRWRFIALHRKSRHFAESLLLCTLVDWGPSGTSVYSQVAYVFVRFVVDEPPNAILEGILGRALASLNYSSSCRLP